MCDAAVSSDAIPAGRESPVNHPTDPSPPRPTLNPTAPRHPHSHGALHPRHRGHRRCLQPKGDSNKYEFVYEPNFNWGITETWFNGQIEVNTADKQIKYAKTFDLDAIALKVNGVFDYDKNVPYVGFKVLTKPGVSSAAGDSSGFSVCKTISQNIGPLTLSADIASSVALGEQTYNPSKKSMESSPAQVEFNAVKLILEA